MPKLKLKNWGWYDPEFKDRIETQAFYNNNIIEWVVREIAKKNSQKY